MDLPTHPGYTRLAETAERSHSQNRSPHGITAEDVALARLYCYAFRRHTIGAFHATRQAIVQQPQPGPLAAAHRLRAVEVLEDLANEAMLPIPRDFRAVICTFWRYHRGIARVLESLEYDHADSRNGEILRIGERFDAWVTDTVSLRSSSLGQTLPTKVLCPGSDPRHSGRVVHSRRSRSDHRRPRRYCA